MTRTPHSALRTPNLLSLHFAYATGRLGALEDQLLTQTDIDRFLGAHSGGEAVRMLRDIEFLAAPEEGIRNQGSGIGDRGSGIGFRDVLDASVKLVKENVERMVPQECRFIFDLLWIEGDRALLSYLIKEKRGFVSSVAVKPEPLVSVWPEEEWRRVIEGGTANDPDDDRSEPVQRILSAEVESPGEIDDLVAEVCEGHMRKLAKMSKSYAIYMYVIHIIDTHHTHSLLRSGERESGIEAIAMQKEAVESLREHLDDMRRMVLGPEPVFSYAARAMSHIALLKVLLTGKVNNLPIQEIKSVLPPLL